jgi:hypothetical protein
MTSLVFDRVAIFPSLPPPSFYPTSAALLQIFDLRGKNEKTEKRCGGYPPIQYRRKNRKEREEQQQKSNNQLLVDTGLLNLKGSRPIKETYQ